VSAQARRNASKAGPDASIWYGFALVVPPTDWPGPDTDWRKPDMN